MTVSRTTLRTLAAVFGMLCVGPLLTAHHSPAKFDQERELVLEGVVTRLEWVNPHVYIHVEAENELGEDVTWVIEAQSPRVMSLFGWSESAIEIGSQVSVAANPARNPDSTMALGRSVTAQDGSFLKIPWSPDTIREAIRSEPPSGVGP